MNDNKSPCCSIKVAALLAEGKDRFESETGEFALSRSVLAYVRLEDIDGLLLDSIEAEDEAVGDVMTSGAGKATAAAESSGIGLTPGRYEIEPRFLERVGVKVFEGEVRPDRPASGEDV